jgi:hypothetical protein
MDVTLSNETLCAPALSGRRQPCHPRGLGTRAVAAAGSVGVARAHAFNERKRKPEVRSGAAAPAGRRRSELAESSAPGAARTAAGHCFAERDIVELTIALATYEWPAGGGVGRALCCEALARSTAVGRDCSFDERLGDPRIRANRASARTAAEYRGKSNAGLGRRGRGRDARGRLIALAPHSGAHGSGSVSRT